MMKVFEKKRINGLELANSFVRSATAEGASLPNDEVSKHHTATLAALAKGGVGLIIAGSASVSPEGGAPGIAGIYADSQIEGHRRTTDAVHAGGGKIALQIFHNGKMTSKAATGLTVLAVSKDNDMGDDVKEMDAADFKRIGEAFVQATVRAKKAGYDAVQFHVAHGYFLHQVLSPMDNRRTDEYGGTLEKRIRFIAESIAATRKAVGPDYPLLLKISSEDFIEGGVTLEDALEATKQFVAAGIDAVETSSGLAGDIARLGINSFAKEAYNRKQAAYFKENLSVPVMLVGGLRSLDVAEIMLKDGVADFISLSRPLIAEPDLINRWKSGSTEKAFCKSCNGCFKPLMTGDAVVCSVKRALEKKNGTT
ncbi:NADH:flavin oxidoreductase [Halodesulfovibrio marinisediminis]|uniref:2,4-dienoyl-CoA reductase n=1 Tax=Halodesulfovibrio marinisediminis DSM 17456 TaxID=1121457 RepID=A0A1N6EA86_9BACT|nr:NADH:flavin oxidoreductase [Halodesulfovibrio marinisediminis]SIN79827.1 2,4-dienoyl-CoA reductase [Halodesulfovibrio marinisediminis DSM 17456]